MNDMANSVIDKFSVLDFINVLISGGLFSLGISFLMNRNIYKSLYSSIIETENVFAIGLIVLGCCYMIGAVLQILAIILFGRIKSTIRGSFLNESAKGLPQPFMKILKALGFFPIVNNRKKRKSYYVLAQNLFNKKKFGTFVNNKENCGYYFEYCEYYNTVRGLNGKTEKMRELSGLCESIAVCVLLLLFVSLWLRSNYTVWLIPLLLGSVYRAVLSRINWGRMILATYEAAVDYEESNTTPKSL